MMNGFEAKRTVLREIPVASVAGVDVYTIYTNKSRYDTVLLTDGEQSHLISNSSVWPLFLRSSKKRQTSCQHFDQSSRSYEVDRIQHLEGHRRSSMQDLDAYIGHTFLINILTKKNPKI
jgi:hypothetical protein